MIGDTLTAAVDARRRDDPAAFEGSLDVLFTAARPELSAAVVLRLIAAVLAAWTRGWQPADVARAVRRVHSAHHVRLAVDMIAGQLAATPVDTVDERWTEALQALDARVWWSSAEDYLPAWAVRERIDIVLAVRYAVEVLAVLEALPSLPHLSARPGGGRGGGPGAGSGPGRVARRGGRDAAGRMLDRVRALLAKAESSQFDSEAEAYTAKAQELIARHSVDVALLSHGDDRDQPIAVRVGVDPPYEEARALLLQNVAEANLCRSVWSGEFGFATVFGFADDIAAVELIYGSLLVQGTATMVREGSGGRSRNFRQSFLYAYAVRIGQRLAATSEAARSEVPDLLPVLASRQAAVQRSVAEVFEKFTGRRVRVSDERGWLSGTAAADRARLHGRGGIDH